MGLGKTNRRKGHNAERYYAKVFRDLGYSHCVTSRYGSRIHDNAGIDFIHLPFNIQLKAGKHRGINYSQVLKYTRDRILKLFPKKSEDIKKIDVLIHRKDVGRGKSRTDYDDLVVMTFNDFKKLIKETNYGIENSK